MNQTLLGKANPKPPQHYRPQANQHKIESQTQYSSVAYTTSSELSSSHYSVVDYPDDMQGQQRLIKPSHNHNSMASASRTTAAPPNLALQTQPKYHEPSSNEHQAYLNISIAPHGNFQQGDYEVDTSNASQEGVYELLGGAYEFDDSRPIRSIDEEEDNEETNEENYPYSYARVGTLEVKYITTS